MTEHSVTHATFSVERYYPVPRARVFRALSDPAAKSRWFGNPNAEVITVPHELDFRVGGRERLAGGRKTGPIHTFEAIYYDIVPEVRTVYAYEMYADDRRISVSLGTMELHEEDGGTRLVYTEQGAFLDGLDRPEHRQHGTEELLDALGESLASAAGAS
jgi:uncharacterized protein YndB with AHSA1/START domain